MCDLLEEVVKLDPSLIQVRVCFYALSIVLHHYMHMWHLKALVRISYSNGMDADLCKPTLGDRSDRWSLLLQIKPNCSS